MFAGCSSARFRVRVWGACGRKFESCHPDKWWQKPPMKVGGFLYIAPSDACVRLGLYTKSFACKVRLSSFVLKGRGNQDGRSQSCHRACVRFGLYTKSLACKELLSSFVLKGRGCQDGRSQSWWKRLTRQFLRYARSSNAHIRRVCCVLSHFASLEISLVIHFRLYTCLVSRL